MRGRGRAPAGAALALVALAAAGCWVERVPEERREPGSEPEPVAADSAVPVLLRESASGWNAGDLSAFLAPYRRDSAVTYIGGGGLRRGFEELRERYSPLFGAGARRDSLRFDRLRTRSLGDDHALTTGRYVLYRDGESTETGLFTLVWSRLDGRWRILHDHSSPLTGR